MTTEDKKTLALARLSRHFVPERHANVSVSNLINEKATQRSLFHLRTQLSVAVSNPKQRQKVTKDIVDIEVNRQCGADVVGFAAGDDAVYVIQQQC